MSSGRRTAEKPASPLRFIGAGLSYLALCATALVALVLIVIPLVTGSQTFSVLTSSMAPHYAPGTFLVVKPTPFEELRTGDVITYQIESGSSAVITHRINSIGTAQDGERTLFTKGDNNAIVDPEPVREVQVRGKLFYAVPFIGFAANALGNSDRGEAIQWGAVALLGYGIVTMVRGALAKKRGEGDSGPAEADNGNPGNDLTDGGAAPVQAPRASVPMQDPFGHDDPHLEECEHCNHDSAHPHIHSRRKPVAV
ncbi:MULTISPECIES: signal peptidase I [unclassified Arthrobacter]|uniref:signal peptidase I n=1 Tax=unclassified Arthrobacter TaxID=235627 RepID=UPI001E3065DF|nr:MULTISPECIES: signal peptidase I [unclassified Arthrobacter]MCC9146150.1 signal peptidase I [Arthrobacter sp. zg-Y919]MDK1277380.1 signal peptidase I [Arthrobacter sp. zg.Y919]WIB03877.1 signal peptidase I [Arthrobacter sp. zg-Y919]